MQRSVLLFHGKCYYSAATAAAAAAAAKSLQSCPNLFNPIDGSPLGSSVPEILQARTLEWVAISFSNASKWKVKVKSFNGVRLCATPWTVAYQAPPPMGFSRQEYWSGVPLPSPSICIGRLKLVKIDISQVYLLHAKLHFIERTGKFILKFQPRIEVDQTNRINCFHKHCGVKVKQKSVLVSFW